MSLIQNITFPQTITVPKNLYYFAYAYNYSGLICIPKLETLRSIKFCLPLVAELDNENTLDKLIELNIYANSHSIFKFHSFDDDLERYIQDDNMLNLKLSDMTIENDCLMDQDKIRLTFSCLFSWVFNFNIKCSLIVTINNKITIQNNRLQLSYVV